MTCDVYVQNNAGVCVGVVAKVLANITVASTNFNIFNFNNTICTCMMKLKVCALVSVHDRHFQLNKSTVTAVCHCSRRVLPRLCDNGSQPIQLYKVVLNFIHC